MKNKVYLIIKILIAIVGLTTTCFLIKTLLNLDILPFKYLTLGIALFVSFNILAIISLFVKKAWTKVIAAILYLIIIIPSIVGIYYGGKTNEFLDTAFDNHKTEITRYVVVVTKKSSYTSLAELNNKDIGYLDDKEDASYLDKLQEKVQVNIKSYDDLYELYDALVMGNITGIIFNEAYLDIIDEDYAKVDNDVRELDAILIETEVTEQTEEETTTTPTTTSTQTTNNTSSKTTKKKGSTASRKTTTSPPMATKKVINSRSFNVFISGSDSRSNNIANKSRSDVNMIVTINRDTKTILLTSIPRDYYVQVHGKKGLKDKLTHAGIYGLNVSTATVEDLFNINIAYSIKIGMNSVVKLVDLVGGIEVYSDKTFKSYHMPGWTVKKGMNQMNGAKALAYARERYAYAGGDRHRILNQQQVLEATLKKLSTNAELLLKYDELLTSLGNLYRTDMPKEMITSFIKEQLDDMSTWTFVTQSVDGKGASRATYTAPKSKRYVMIPYDSDVTRARKKILSVLG